MSDVQAETPLGGGRTTRVVKVGDTVRRTAGPWTPTIHAYLRHLRAKGLTIVPQGLGLDERGREIVTFIPGETVGDSIDPNEPVSERVVIRRLADKWRTDESLARIARMVRSLHDAARDFHPESPIWREYDFPTRPGEIVCHADLGPWNTVYRGGDPVAFIDFDGTHPEMPIRDLAAAAWHFVPLGPDELRLAQGFEQQLNYGERLRLFCDAYGLTDRSEMLTALSEVKQRSAYLLRHWQPLRPGAGANWLRDVAAGLDWLEKHTDELRQFLR